MTQPHWKMAVDVTRCIGCHACSAACKVENDIPPLGSFRTKVCCCDEGGYPQVKAISCRPCACKCEDAPCVAACRTEALPGDSMPRYVPIPSHQDLPAAWASSMAGGPRQRGAALAERTRHTHPPKSKTTSTSPIICGGTKRTAEEAPATISMQFCRPNHHRSSACRRGTIRFARSGACE